MEKEKQGGVEAATQESLKEKVSKHYDEKKGAEETQTQQATEPVTERRSVISLILDHLLGRKYYAVVSNRIGTFRVGIHENICSSRAEAKQLLQGVKSFQELEIISFRSRNNYVRRVDENGYTYYTIED